MILEFKEIEKKMLMLFNDINKFERTKVINIADLKLLKLYYKENSEVILYIKTIVEGTEQAFYDDFTDELLRIEQYIKDTKSLLNSI